MKLQDNDRCWCGAHSAYEKCHKEFDVTYEKMKAEGNIMPPRSLIKNNYDIKMMKASAQINNGVLDEVAKYIKEGMTTEEINNIVYNYTVLHGAIPAPLNFEGYPKSVCTSLNNVVCHGIPTKKRALKNGDIINVDVSTIKDKYFSDASRMFCIGEVSEKTQKLVDVTYECLQKGIEAVKPWGHLGDIGAAIMEHAHNHNYSVVLDCTGHGIGKEFHEDPVVNHVGNKGKGMVLAPGMCFTIEPMINEGTHRVVVDRQDGWTIRTKDGKLSAQWENMILVTNTGIEILSK